MPLPSTYTPIASMTLTAITANPTFTNIPQGYTDLVISAQPGVTGDFRFRINGDTAGNYSDFWLIGDGTNAVSYKLLSNTGIGLNYASNSTGRAITVNIMNYSNATTHKSTITKTGHGNSAVELAYGCWRSTAAVTSITFAGTNSYPVGATFALYGIKAA